MKLYISIQKNEQLENYKKAFEELEQFCKKHTTIFDEFYTYEKIQELKEKYNLGRGN